MVLRHVDRALPLQLADGTDAAYQPPTCIRVGVLPARILRFNERLGGEGIEFRSFIPRLWLPVLLQKLGYRTHAMVSLPVLNPTTAINTGFDSFTLMEKHNDMRAMLQQMKFRRRTPVVLLTQCRETHYPYALPMSLSTLAAHQRRAWCFQHLDDLVVGGKLRRTANPHFTNRALKTYAAARSKPSDISTM